MRAARRHAVLAVGVVAGASACASLLGVEEVGYSTDAGAVDVAPGDSPLGETAPPDGGGDGACTDTGTDPANCGRCGHSCLGGACEAGVCQPLIVAAGEHGCIGAGCDTSLVADDDAVYWTTYDLHYTDAGADVTPGHLAKADCDGGGCSPARVLAPGLANGGALALDPTNVYFATGVLTLAPGTIYRCPKSGCAPAPVVVCNPPLIYKMSTYADRLYWTDNKNPGSVYESLSSGCGASAKTIGSASGAVTDDVRVTAAAIYVTTGSQLLRAQASGGPLLAMSGPQVGVFYAAIEGQFIYWSVGDLNGGVYQCTLSGDCAGAAPTPIALNQGKPGPIAADPSGVYWANTDDPPSGSNIGTIVACAGPSCADGGLTMLAAGQRRTTAIAVNKDSIFWANSDDGTIMRLAKP